MKILSETGVSAGVRRIEGVTGYNVILQMREKSKLIDDVSSVLKTNPSDLLNRAEGIVAEQDARHEIDSLKSKLAKNSVDDIFGKY